MPEPRKPSLSRQRVYRAFVGGEQIDVIAAKLKRTPLEVEAALRRALRSKA
jgi:hypothetical protein